MSEPNANSQADATDPSAPPASMYCRDCRTPLHGTEISRCPTCGRPYNPANPRTYVPSPDVRRFNWHGVISWGMFLLAQFYGGLAFTTIGMTGLTLTPYGLIIATGVIIAIIGTRKPPWLNQVICFIALMAYALTVVSVIMFKMR